MAACHPWDSPGKNTGVGCRFLLQCMNGKSESEVTQSCPTLCDPMDYSLTGSSIPGIYLARILEWVAVSSSTGSSYPGIKLRSPTLQEDSSLSEPPGKPKNTGMGSLSFLQGNFPNQKLNHCFLHCRWILYQLSCLGSPNILIWLCWVLVVACGIKFPDQELNFGLLLWEQGVLEDHINFKL